MIIIGIFLAVAAVVMMLVLKKVDNRRLKIQNILIEQAHDAGFRAGQEEKEKEILTAMKEEQERHNKTLEAIKAIEAFNQEQVQGPGCGHETTPKKKKNARKKKTKKN